MMLITRRILGIKNTYIPDSFISKFKLESSEKVGLILLQEFENEKEERKHSGSRSNDHLARL